MVRQGRTGAPHLLASQPARAFPRRRHEPRGPDSALDDDTWNLRCFHASRGRALDDVLADLWRTQQAILDGIAALPASLFFTAGAHGGALWEAVDGTVLGHYPEHIAQIARWQAQHVTPPTTKADLLFRIADGYAALTATLDAVPPRELALPALHGGWAIKDEVAHLTFWQSYVLTILHAVLAGQEPPYTPSVGSAEKIDAENADAFAATRQQLIDDVFADLERTHTAFMRAVTDLPDDTLFDAHRFPWMNGEPLAAAVAGDSYEHYPEHIRNIQRWRAVESVRGFAR